MPVALVILCIGVFAFFATNVGERGEKPGLKPVWIALVVALMGYLLWPSLAPFIGPLIPGK
jgi:hypothetical protein